MRRLPVLFALLALIAAPVLAHAQGASSPFPYSIFVTLQPTTTASASNGNTLSTAYAAIAVIQTVMTSTGTVNFEASLDGVNWSSIFCFAPAVTNPITGTAAVSSVTASGFVKCNVVGYPQIRARISANGGSITVSGNATSSLNSVGSAN